jgi:hypothetical protein
VLTLRSTEELPWTESGAWTYLSFEEKTDFKSSGNDVLSKRRFGDQNRPDQY